MSTLILYKKKKTVNLRCFSKKGDYSTFETRGTNSFNNFKKECTSEMRKGKIKPKCR